MKDDKSDVVELIKAAQAQPFSPAFAAIGLKKGDVPGHEFHGNQWTGGGGNGGEKDKAEEEGRRLSDSELNTYYGGRAKYLESIQQGIKDTEKEIERYSKMNPDEKVPLSSAAAELFGQTHETVKEHLEGLNRRLVGSRAAFRANK